MYSSQAFSLKFQATYKTSKRLILTVVLVEESNLLYYESGADSIGFLFGSQEQDGVLLSLPCLSGVFRLNLPVRYGHVSLHVSQDDQATSDTNTSSLGTPNSWFPQTEAQTGG